MLRVGVVIQLLLLFPPVVTDVLADALPLPRPLAEEKMAPSVTTAAPSVATAAPSVATAASPEATIPPAVAMAPPIDLLGEATQVAGYLLILIVLAALAVHLGRRFRPGLGGEGPIHVLDGRNLAPGIGVRLIRVGSQSWLVGVTKERVSLLAEITTEDLAISTPSMENNRAKPTTRTGIGNHAPNT